MPTWEEIFSSRDEYNMQLLIEVSGGTYLTNTEIAQESFSLTEMLSDTTDLKFGGCNASQFRIRIRSSVQNMTGKTIVVKQFAYTDADIRIVINNGIPVEYNTRTEETSALGDDYFLYGTYKVRTDKPTPDKAYRDISAFDAMERIISEDIGEWYTNFFDTYDKVTLKFFREAILDYFGITYDDFTGVNDTVAVSKTITTTAISAKTILSAICELNGCFGVITRDNKFKCKVLDTTTVAKRYDRYKQGQVNYQDALSNVITQVQIVNDLSKANATIGVAGNPYTINDNVLLLGKDSTELETIATRLLPVVSACAYRPFTCSTYGDPCIELGDFIQIPTIDETIESFVLYRELTGTQALGDKLEAKGEEYNASGATGSSAVISQLYSSMSQVKDESSLSYYLFRSATELTVEDGEDPVRIARIRYANTGDTTVDIWHEFKMDVDFTEGSDRCKVYAYFYYDDNLIEYYPVETYAIDDLHTFKSNYAFFENQSGYHTWEVFLATEGGDATIDIGDAGITLHGQGLITKGDWDGLIDADDVIEATFSGAFIISGIEEDVEFDTLIVDSIDATDVITATFSGAFVISGITDEAHIFMTMYTYNWIDENSDNIIDDNGDSIIFVG